MTDLINKLNSEMTEHRMTPPDHIEANGKVHIFMSGQRHAYYVADNSKPKIGFYGFCNTNSEPIRCTYKYANPELKQKRDKKAEKMLKRIKKELEKKHNSSGVVLPADDTNDSISAIINAQNQSLTEYQMIVERLAKLETCQYDQLRKVTAKRYGVRSSTLDCDVKNAKTQEKQDKTVASRLISDCCQVFTEKGTDRLGSIELISALSALSPFWAIYSNGRPIDPKTLANILRPHGISPIDVKINKVNVKGYNKSNFMEVLESIAVTE